MNPIRRELLNGLFVLIFASLMSAAVAAFQIKFDVQLWVLILIAVGVAVSGYVIFEVALLYMALTEEREKEWLKRIGTPARFQVGAQLADAIYEGVKYVGANSDYTVMSYFGFEGGAPAAPVLEVRGQGITREKGLASTLELLRRGTFREYKRIICFDHDVLANDLELKSGVLRIGEGPGTIDRVMGEHCRIMMQTKGCSLFVAPAVLQSTIVLFGSDKVAMTVETAAQATRGRTMAGVFFFYDPPNREIIEQYRQIERETEKRMVAVHKIVFPEDVEPKAEAATR